MTESTELATQPQTTAAATTPRQSRYTPEEMAAATISIDTQLPSIQDAQPANVSLSIEYWSAQEEGESKRGWVLGIAPQQVIDMETGEIKTLECVLFVEDCPDGKKARFYSAAKVLVGNVASAIDRGEIIPGTLLTPVEITYLGKKKNQRNQRMSGRWQILPLVVG